MNYPIGFANLMPILAVVFTLVLLVAVIIVGGKIIQTRILSLNQRSFEEIAKELRADNETIRAELADMKVTLDTLHQMMKEVE